VLSQQGVKNTNDVIVFQELAAFLVIAVNDIVDQFQGLVLNPLYGTLYKLSDLSRVLDIERTNQIFMPFEDVH
jgi:hypothetical protein